MKRLLSSLKPLFFVIACICMHSTPASALPMLSLDGSTMTGVEIGGVSYDLHFQDGILGEIYDSAMVLDSGWGELSQSISEAIWSAINSLELFSSGLYFSGCSDPSFCMAFLPDSLEGDHFIDSNLPAAYFPVLTPPVDFVDIFRLSRDFDTASRSDITLVTFSQSSVQIPEPGVLGLLILGMVLMSGTWIRSNCRIVYL